MSIILSTHYYDQWFKHSHVADTTKAAITRELKRLEHFLILCGFPEDEKINFDNFYYDKLTGIYEPFDEEMMDNFILNLKSKQCSSNLIYNSIVYLRSFFKFLKESNLIKHNPVEFYRNSHYKRPIRNNWLSEEECNKLLAFTYNQEPPGFNQDYVLVLLLTTTGLRNSEITNLCYFQIDFERDVIYVDKGQKTTANSVYMPEELKRVLKEYINHPKYKQWLQDGNTELFYTNTRKPYTPVMLNLKVKKLGEEAQVKHLSISARTFRFTCARLMYESGINLITIQRQLRHKYVATTLRYLGFDSASRALIEDLSVFKPEKE